MNQTTGHTFPPTKTTGSSAGAVIVTGITRSSVYFHSVDSWSIPEHLLCKGFDAYFLRYWGMEFLLKEKIVDGHIIYKDLPYIFIPYQCSIDSLRACGPVKLSFRKPKAIFELPAIVLVKGN